MAPTSIPSPRPWQRLAVVVVALPVVVGLAVLAFAYPAARTEPRHLPVGIVGTSPDSQELVTRLDLTSPGGFDFHLYADSQAARTAIQDRDVYGAFQISGHQVQVLIASAASPAVAQTLERITDTVNHALVTGTGGAALATQQSAIDVTPLPADDPKGAVFTACLLPLTICSMLAAAVTGLVVRFRPAWRQLVALAGVSVLSAAAVYVVGQSYLGAFPHHGFADWAVIALAIFAISSSTAGLIALVGSAGLASGAVLMVFIGNPLSGATSAPELLPDVVRNLGQVLPPGATASALRSSAYFDGHAIGGHLAVLIGWSVLGIATLIIGHHAPLQLAAQRPTQAELATQRLERGAP